MNKQSFDLFCIGNALIETTIRVDDKYLEKNELCKGRMYLIDKEKNDALFANYMPQFESYIPAGAECNVAITLQQLGGKSFFHGKVGCDDDGKKYRKMLADINIGNNIVFGNLSTGKIFSFITPDNERTMLTYLGASLTFSKNEIDLKLLLSSKMLYISAFFWEPNTLREGAIHVLNYAKSNQIPIAFDVSDAFIVGTNRILLFDILIKYCSIIFMNEDEAQSLGRDFLSDLINLEKTVVIKKGADGASIFENKIEYKIPSVKVAIVDTTGAGDSFASAFIFSKLSGFETQKAGEFAAQVASKAISHYGSCLLK